MRCNECISEEAEWYCSNCDGVYGDECLDAYEGKCPECDIDPGWEEVY